MSFQSIMNIETDEQETARLAQSPAAERHLKAGEYLEA